MAVLANGSLGSLVWVIFFMTVATACRWLGIKQGLDVATRAFNIGMRALERVSGIDVVIECQLRPLVGDMACFAAFAKVPVMIVVVFMT